MELPEKIESNLVSYLQGLTFPAYFTAALVHAGETDIDKATQVLQVVCAEAESEEPAYSGNFWHPVAIELRTALYLQTDRDKTSQDPAVATAQLTKHKAMAALLSDAICTTDLPAQINSIAQAQVNADTTPNTDLRAFALIGFTDRKPTREQNDNYIMSGFSLKLYACANAAAA